MNVVSPRVTPTTRRIRSRVERIRRMSVPELTFRGRQQMSTWLARLAPADISRPADVLRERAPGLADPCDALRVLRDAVPGRFFAGPRDPGAIAIFRSQFADDCQLTEATANDIVENGRFNVLGYRNVWFGDPIDWHADPLHDRRAPRVHWSRIDPLDADELGDSKIIWELNRHQWLVTLAQAWTLTGDERYAAACVRLVEAWLEQNPPGLGINWASSLEVAYRLVSWTWMLALLREWPQLPLPWLTRVLASIGLHADHVRGHLSRYFSPNTHLTGEALGLLYAAIVFPEFRDAARWRSEGADILDAQSAVQIHDDGVFFEQSTCYQCYTVEIYLHYLLLAAENGIAVPSRVQERVSRMVDFLLTLRRPDGSMPSVGDEDGGQIARLREVEPHDRGWVFGVAAVLFRKPAFAWAAAGPTPNLLWLLGSDGLRSLASVPTESPRDAVSRVFPSGGYAIVRSSWESNAHQAVLDVGPLGCSISGAHGHADLLSLQCSIFGEPCIVDPGTYVYSSDPEWRDFFRSTAAHSTVMVDARGQAEPSGHFSWGERPAARLREWRSEAAFDYVDAEHDAYATLSDPVTHRRRLVFIKPDSWIVIDDLWGTARHRVDLHFQFAPIRVVLEPSGWTHAHTPRGHALWLASFSQTPLWRSLHCGEVNPTLGWFSPEYGRKVPAPLLRVSCGVRLPWRAVTVLLPDAGQRTAPPEVRRLHDEQGWPSGVVIASVGRISFDDRSLYVDRF